MGGGGLTATGRNPAFQIWHDLVYKMVLVPEIKVLLSRDQIAKRVTEMAEQITRDFEGQSIIFVGVLKGAAIFLSDLARQVPLDATFDFIGVSSYGNRPTPTEDPAGHAAWDSLGEVRVTKDLDQSMIDQNVILVEDILDTSRSCCWPTSRGPCALQHCSTSLRGVSRRSMRTISDSPFRMRMWSDMGLTTPNAIATSRIFAS
jgi:hypoxanthine phosphoribosyltransferase